MGYRFHVITNLDESFEHGNHNQVLISRMADSITKLNENQWKINTLFVEKLKKKLIKENNGKVEVLQLGAPNLIGSLGLIDLFNEIVCDKSVKSGIDMFFLPVGTGFNLACLYIASHMFNCNKIKFRGISVARNTNQVSLFINKFIHDFNSYFSMSIPTNWNDRITLHDDFIGEGYGRISKSEYSELNSELLNDGFSFDNVYNQKSLFGMIDLLKKEGDLNKETILYLNTGAYTSQLSFT
jgi:1-aminocyclopropane-1-carboxylate deaminase/D-cysteine desulfhydrase-like pyridoxal-dependent ACC family enzyme